MATNAIVKDAKNISLTTTPAAAKGTFCDIWPMAKTALGLLKDMVKNPVLKGVITSIIAAGDAVASRVCG